MWTFAGFPHRFNNFHTVQVDAKTVVPIGDRLAFIPSFNFRFLFGDDVPVAYFNAIGGSLQGRYLDQQIPFLGVTNLHATDVNLRGIARDRAVVVQHPLYPESIWKIGEQSH